MQDEFMSLVAHQLREPLAITRWSIELLEEEDLPSLPPSAQEKIKNIAQSNETMIEIVNDMLEVSRIEQGKVVDEPEKIEVNIIIKAVLDLLTQIAKKRNISLEFTPKSEIFLTLDKAHFTHILKNIIENAVKFSKSDSKVVITTSVEGNVVTIKVADTGIGIPQLEQKSVWDRFYRASNAIRSGIPGTGLGLYMVQSYVNSWSGKVWLESIEGSSTNVYISLPVS